MTKTDWNSCTDPHAMLDWLRQQGKLSDRKARLFCCGAVRQVWHLLTAPRLRGAVEIAERYADGLCTGKELQSAEEQAHAARFTLDRMLAPEYLVFFAASVVAMKDMTVFTSDHYRFGRSSFLTGVVAREDGDWKRGSTEAENARICSLLRDIFANPLRPPPPLALSLLIGQDYLVRRLAEEVYSHRIMPAGTLDPQRLAVLADALLEAGCDDADIIGHLRGLRPHWRGCHVLDLILAKE